MTDLSAAERTVRRSTLWVFVALALMAAVFVRALAFTPVEATQGAAQKIFYIHAPSAWVAFMAFGVVGVCSMLFLILKDPRLDRLAASSAEVGLVFVTAVLITGPLWGRPIWGAWWVWDARLTSTLFLWFIYFGYLVLRGAVQEPGQRARFCAVLGILGAMLVPFIHVTVYLFRTQHPLPVVLNTSGTAAARRDARHPAVLAECLHALLRVARLAALRTGGPRRCARRAARGTGGRPCLTTAATWSRPTWRRRYCMAGTRCGW